MLLSVFAFSGYTDNPAQLNSTKAQTGLVCQGRAEINKPVVTCKKAINTAPEHFFPIYFNNYKAAVLLTYNKLIKVKFDNLSEQYQLIEWADKFFQLKNIPRNSGKDIFISIG